jgi:two-component system phosphate regulon response regulator OmpR
MRAGRSLRAESGRMNDARTRLLVVDDDPSIRAMLREYLEGHGYAVAEAGNGVQLRAAVEHDQIVVVAPGKVLASQAVGGDIDRIMLGLQRTFQKG